MTHEELIGLLRSGTGSDTVNVSSEQCAEALWCVEALVRELDEARRVCVTMLEDARAAEREACARVCEAQSLTDSGAIDTIREVSCARCADAIRARGDA